MVYITNYVDSKILKLYVQPCYCQIEILQLLFKSFSLVLKDNHDK